MHIAIDISPLSSAHQGRGIGVYTKELIQALQTYEPKHTYELVDGRKNDAKRADIIHYPYFDPFFLTLPILKKKPTIVTVHDVIPLVFPDKFPVGFRGNVKWLIQKASLMGATRIVTDSDNSKHDIHKIIGFDEKRIDRVYLAPSDVFRSIKDKATLNGVKKKYDLPEQFLLYVGDVNWNKNISGLLRAYDQLTTSKTQNKIPLVLVGKAFTNHALKEMQEIDLLIHTFGLNDSIIRPGFVSEEELACLYSMATCLVQPSYYEGFGLPVLEAFACGCPVVAADNSSLTEIIGPSIKVFAHSPESIASGIRSIATLSSKGRTELIRRGTNWVKQFTWKKVARETMNVYEKILVRSS